MTLRPKPSLDPIRGNPDLASRLEALNVSYLLLEQRLDFVKGEFGQAGVDDVAGRLGPESRRSFLERPERFSWHPVARVLDMDAAILAGPLQGDPSRLDEMGSYNAQKHLNGVMRAFLWVAGDPGLVIRRMTGVIPKYYQGADSVLVDETPGRHVFRVEGVVIPYHFCHHMVPGWSAKALTLGGGQDVAVTHEHCVHHGDAHCEWQAAWR